MITEEQYQKAMDKVEYHQRKLAEYQKITRAYHYQLESEMVKRKKQNNSKELK